MQNWAIALFVAGVTFLGIYICLWRKMRFTAKNTAELERDAYVAFGNSGNVKSKVRFDDEA